MEFKRVIFAAVMVVTKIGAFAAAVGDECIVNGGFEQLTTAKRSGGYGSLDGADRTSRYGGIYYGEVIVYNRALTSEDQQGVYSYLYDKWWFVDQPFGPTIIYVK